MHSINSRENPRVVSESGTLAHCAALEIIIDEMLISLFELVKRVSGDNQAVDPHSPLHSENKFNEQLDSQNIGDHGDCRSSCRARSANIFASRPASVDESLAFSRGAC